MKDIILTKNRQVKHCPPHFTKVIIDVGGSKVATLSQVLSSGRESKESRVRFWLHKNIENRFYVGKDTDFENNLLVENLIAAFEDPAEATYFSLVMPGLLASI